MKDDEIADDETIEGPPPLKDLDLTFHTTASRPPDGAGGAESSHLSDSSQSEYVRPVRSGRSGIGAGTGGGGNSMYGRGAGDDEFDF